MKDSSASDPSSTSTPLAADFAPVQAHYDLSDAFFALFLDPSRTYSCAKFTTPGMTLEAAQLAKIDLSLGKCDLRPSHRLLDIGCGWGATARRAHERYGVNVTGLTLSRNQHAFAQEHVGRPEIEFRLEGWETFTEKVDRIVSIGAFEHFGRDKYPAFFERARALLPSDGVMLLHTITIGKPNKSMTFGRFVHFISTNIFPGGDVPAPERVIGCARTGGFELTHVESLRLDYAQTLDAWAANLAGAQTQAVALVGDERYRTYMRYLTSCAAFFRSGEINVYQFTLHVA